jgi:hypothetical protein
MRSGRPSSGRSRPGWRLAGSSRSTTRRHRGDRGRPRGLGERGRDRDVGRRRRPGEADAAPVTPVFRLVDGAVAVPHRQRLPAAGREAVLRRVGAQEPDRRARRWARRSARPPEPEVLVHRHVGRLRRLEERRQTGGVCWSRPWRTSAAPSPRPRAPSRTARMSRNQHGSLGRWPPSQSQNAAYRAPPSSVSGTIFGRVAASTSSNRAACSGGSQTAAPSTWSSPATDTAPIGPYAS